MQFKLPNPQRSLLVILGASSFAKAPSFAEGVAFYNSMHRVLSYLTSKNGLGIDRPNVLQLFDDSRPPGSQLEDIVSFLSARQAPGAAVDPPENLFVYYVGHGLFTTERRYCLAVRCTSESNIGISAIRGRDLADVISENAIQLRRFLILDCCFAASMYGEFLSAPGEAATTQLLEELPVKGTCLLCASSPQDVALAPKSLECTMFSDALLRALNVGNRTLGPRISLAELGAMVTNILKRDYPSDWVRPEIHSPDMRAGDISAIPLFPNSAWAPVHEDLLNVHESRKAEEEARAQREAAEQERLAKAEQERLAKAEQERLAKAPERLAKADPERLAKAWREERRAKAGQAGQEAVAKRIESPPASDWERTKEKIKEKIFVAVVCAAFVGLVAGANSLWDHFFPKPRPPLDPTAWMHSPCANTDFPGKRVKADTALAISNCREEIRNFPEEGHLHFILGRLLEENSEVSGALSEYEAALELDHPPNPVYKSNVERVRALLKNSREKPK